MLHRQQRSSGAMTSTSSSSPQSTHHLTEGGGLTTPVGRQSRHQRCHAHRRRHARRQLQASPRPISEPSSCTAAREKMSTPPLSIGARGAATLTVTTTLQKPLLWGMLHIPLFLRGLGVDARCLPRTVEWWSGHANFGLTCR
jgi:hypothetical protein